VTTLTSDAAKASAAAADEELRNFKAVVKPAMKELMIAAKQYLADDTRADDTSREELRGALKKAEAA
jgi:hypothetical protein